MALESRQPSPEEPRTGKRAKIEAAKTSTPLELAKTRLSQPESRDLPEESLEFGEEEISDIFEQAGWGEAEDIGAIEAESSEQLAKMKETYEDITDQLGELELDLEEKLDGNAEALREAMEKEKAEVKEWIADLLKQDGSPKMEAVFIAGNARRHPDVAMDALAENAGRYDFEQKAMIAGAALEQGVEYAALLDAAGFSEAEKRALLVRIAKDVPEQLPSMARAAGVNFSREEQEALALDVADKDPKAFSKIARAFGFSHESLVALLREFPKDRRSTMLDALKIPGTTGSEQYQDLTSSEIARMIESELNPEREADFELISRTNAASRELMLALVSAFPERADRERERYKEDLDLQQPIREVGKLGGNSKNKPSYVKIEGRDLPALYKSRLIERQSRKGIEAGQMVNREALAAIIDRALGLDVVPATVLRDGPEGLGVVQDWKVGEEAIETDFDAPRHHAELQKVALLDLLIRNSDRHAANWLISPDGKHRAIDNGASFSNFSKHADYFDQTMSFPADVVKGTPLPPELAGNLRKVVESPQVMEALKKSFDALLSKDDAAEAWEGFSDRLKKAAGADFVIPESEYLYGSEETDKQSKLLGYA